MRLLFLLVLVTSQRVVFGQAGLRVFGYNGDPTGTYRLVRKSVALTGGSARYQGVIQIKQLPLGSSIVLRLAVSRLSAGGKGSLVDTLLFRHGSAVYHWCPSDSTCHIRFDFSVKGVRVWQESTRTDGPCGFDSGVVAEGYYKKVSSKEPVMTGEVPR